MEFKRGDTVILHTWPRNSGDHTAFKNFLKDIIPDDTYQLIDFDDDRARDGRIIHQCYVRLTHPSLPELGHWFKAKTIRAIVINTE